MKALTRVVVMVAPIMAAGALVFACDVEDEEAGTGKKQFGGTDATTSTATDASGGSDAPTTVPGLCAKVGGPGAVGTLSDKIMAAAQADCRIGIYFSRLAGGGRTHVVECMRRHLQEAFGCPGVVYAGSKSSSGQNCRSMGNAHNDITSIEGKQGLNQADFQAYLEAAVAQFKAAGLTDDELAKIRSVFLGYQGDVAPRAGNTTNTYCTCAGGTFTPAGGQPVACIPDGGYIIPVIDAGTDAPVVRDAAPDTGTPVQDASDDGG